MAVTPAAVKSEITLGSTKQLSLRLPAISLRRLGAVAAFFYGSAAADFRHIPDGDFFSRNFLRRLDMPVQVDGLFFGKRRNPAHEKTDEQRDKHRNKINR